MQQRRGLEGSITRLPIVGNGFEFIFGGLTEHVLFIRDGVEWG